MDLAHISPSAPCNPQTATLQVHILKGAINSVRRSSMHVNPACASIIDDPSLVNVAAKTYPHGYPGLTWLARVDEKTIGSLEVLQNKISALCTRSSSHRQKLKLQYLLSGVEALSNPKRKRRSPRIWQDCNSIDSRDIETGDSDIDELASFNVPPDGQILELLGDLWRELPEPRQSPSNA